VQMRKLLQRKGNVGHLLFSADALAAFSYTYTFVCVILHAARANESSSNSGGPDVQTRREALFCREQLFVWRPGDKKLLLSLSPPVIISLLLFLGAAFLNGIFQWVVAYANENFTASTRSLALWLSANEVMVVSTAKIYPAAHKKLLIMLLC
jgi:hypothetical protein